MAGLRSVAKLMQNDFEDATRKELEKVYEDRSGTPAPQSLSDDELRASVRRIWGTAQPSYKNKVESVESTPKAKGLPNLSSTGKWEGRMRRVTIIKRDNTQADYAQPVGWNGLIWNVPVGVPVDMPWPYYESVKNTLLWDTGSDAVSEYVRDKGGRVSKIVTPTATETIRLVDHGDVPGTEDLPTSYYHHFMREALRSSGFEGYKRAKLIAIRQILKETEPVTFFRDMTDYDIRLEIAVVLGPQVEEILMNEQFA